MRHNGWVKITNKLEKVNLLNQAILVVQQCFYQIGLADFQEKS